MSFLFLQRTSGEPSTQKETFGSFLMHKYGQLSFKVMEGKAAKSANGAAMSKYDVEVEARLKALEKAVKELKSHSHESSGGGGDIQAQLDDLVERLGRKMTF